MDAEELPDGPHTIQGKGTVYIPKSLLAAVGLKVGDQVYVVPRAGTPPTIEVLPASIFAAAARRRLDREQGPRETR